MREGKLGKVPTTRRWGTRKWGPPSGWAEVGGVASVVQVSLTLSIACLWRFGNCHKEG